MRWFLLLGLVGCFSPSPPSNVPCSDGDPCPSGQMCVAGFCDGVPGDANPDTSVDPGDGPADSTPVPSQLSFGEGGGAAIPDTWVDTFLSAGEPANNFGNHGDLHLTSSEAQPILIRVDVTAVPSIARITGARLRFRVSSAKIPEGTVIDVFEMNEGWREGAGDHSADIANLTARTNNSEWSAPGAVPPSRDVGSVANTTAAALLDVSDELVIELPPALIAGWVTDASSNFGIAVIVDGLDFYCELGSSEFPNVDFRPRLELDLE